MSDLSAITWWLAALTILVGVQAVALALLAFRATKLVKRAETTLESAERSFQPVVAEAKDLIADLRALRQTTQRVERRVTSAIDTAERGVQLVKVGVVRRFWPVFGALAAGRAIASRVSARRRASREKRQDDLAATRFDAEGGAQGPPPINDRGAQAPAPINDRGAQSATSEVRSELGGA